jgi:diguanylate cyclase (GGDEF)-like protein
MSNSAEKSHYQFLFQDCPVASLEMDYSFVKLLGQQLQRQTVTNVRQYLTEYPNLIKKMFHTIKLKSANQEAFRLLSVGHKEKMLSAVISVFTSNATDLLVEQVICLLENKKTFSGEFRCRTGRSSFRDIAVKVAVPSLGKNSLHSVLVTLQDITTWKRLERQLRKRAQLDGLTKLLNHNTVMQRLNEELIRAKRYGLSLSCMMIDMDHFKVVNDKFGHPRGDQVLKRVASMIKNCVRTVDLVGRYGGDEFLIIMPETKAANARYAAMRIQNLFSAKIFHYQRIISFHISLSIGITGYPSKRIKDSKDLIALADKAMYQAKKTGRNRIALI